MVSVYIGLRIFYEWSHRPKEGKIFFRCSLASTGQKLSFWAHNLSGKNLSQMYIFLGSEMWYTFSVKLVSHSPIMRLLSLCFIYHPAIRAFHAPWRGFMLRDKAQCMECVCKGGGAWSGVWDVRHPLHVSESLLVKHRLCTKNEFRRQINWKWSWYWL